jgi:hypothetical protein
MHPPVIDGQFIRDPEPWKIHASLDGYVVRLFGEVVAEAPTYEGARAAYNHARAHAAMALESLRHTLAGPDLGPWLERFP